MINSGLLCMRSHRGGRVAETSLTLFRCRYSSAFTTRDVKENDALGKGGLQYVLRGDGEERAGSVANFAQEVVKRQLPLSVGGLSGQGRCFTGVDLLLLIRRRETEEGVSDLLISRQMAAPNS